MPPRPVPAARPKSVRPGEENGLPSAPRPYTDIKSYHAHFYFDEDTYEKAALVRKWSAERFPVELGNWNLTPRGPHVTPSFYFGFTNDLLPILVPWLQLTDHQQSGKNVQIAPHCRLGDTHRPRGLCSIPNLTVVVSEHGPEAKERRSRDPDAQLRHVPFQEGSNELLSPLGAILGRSCQIGAREAAS